MADDMELPESGVAQVRVAALWRRFIAFVGDGLILGVPLMVIGHMFFDAAASLGEWGRVVGLSVGMLYFGVFDSRLGGGQSPGKRMLRVSVMREDASLLTPAGAALRAFIILTPLSLNGIILEGDAGQSVLIALIIGFVLAIIYLFIFNRSRRSLHDLLTGAVVIDARAAQLPFLHPTWKGHWIVAASFLLATVSLVVADSIIGTAPDPKMQQLQAIRKTVTSVPGVKRAGAALRYLTMTTVGTGTTERVFFLVIADMRAAPAQPEVVARQIEDAIFSEHATVFGPVDVMIVLRHGFTFGGIAAASTSFNIPTSLAQWRSKTGHTAL